MINELFKITRRKFFEYMKNTFIFHDQAFLKDDKLLENEHFLIRDESFCKQDEQL